MRTKWQLHGVVLFVLAIIVGIASTALLSASDGRGLDGLGEALAGVFLLFGFGVHALVTTCIVAIARDRSGVALAHVLFPSIVALVALIWIR